MNIEFPTWRNTIDCDQFKYIISYQDAAERVYQVDYPFMCFNDRVYRVYSEDDEGNRIRLSPTNWTRNDVNSYTSAELAGVLDEVFGDSGE